MSFATSFLHLALATILLGISLSTYHPIAFTFINNMANQDRNMGILSVFGNTGSAVTPLIAMFFTVLWGWRNAFLLFAVFQIITGLAFLINFPNSSDFHQQRFNSSNNEDVIQKETTTENHVALFILILVLISALRAPVFRCISYFTSIVFNDAFMFTQVESSILTAVVLGIGALGTYLMGFVNNRRIVGNDVTRIQRVNYRTNSLLLSSGGAAFLLIILVLIPADQSAALLATYLVLTFFFFLGAAILPTIVSEITPDEMGSSFGVLFSGATLTGAISPTIFGFLADTFNFSASFLFLSLVAFGCVAFILLFKFLYNHS
jgi:MFS family permease